MVKFLKLNTRQRKLFADKILDLANFAAAGLIFGQIISQEKFDWRILIVLGFLLVGAFYGFGLKFLSDKKG